ncbi:MAG: type II toxin-antitoxin system VapC family toxin [Pseudohongiellaceae bacterium]
MSYLIDTNIISEVQKGNHCDPQVAVWWQETPEEDVYLSVLVIGEIRKGIELARPQKPQKAAILEQWLEQIEEDFGNRILAVTTDIAEEWGRMGAIRPVSTTDALLAATAKIHGFTLVTRNEADVKDLGVEVFNPFEV